MKKLSKGIIYLAMATITFAAPAAICSSRAVAATSVSAVESAEYYSGITATGGDELLGQLHDLITETHTLYVPYSYSRDYAEYMDPGLDGEGVLEFYTHETLTEFVGNSDTSGSWNREHVWAKADSNGLWGTSGGGADLHHLRPAEKDLNNERGNLRYGEVKNGSPAYSRKKGGGNSKLGGYIGGGAFQPLENVRGDVARIVMYMYTHYNTYSNVHGSTNGGGNSAFFGRLRFTDIIYSSTEQGAIDILLKWNKLDPVDEIEQRRNEGAYGFQGNRNPFIDHPGYADAIWGDEPLGGGGGDAAIVNFRTAVQNIVREGLPQERLASLNDALKAYAVLSEKQRQAAAEEVSALQAAVEEYNLYVNSLNDDAEKAVRALNKKTGSD